MNSEYTSFVSCNNTKHLTVLGTFGTHKYACAQYYTIHSLRMNSLFITTTIKISNGHLDILSIIFIENSFAHSFRAIKSTNIFKSRRDLSIYDIQ